ncbi:hypothetical protein Zmor_024571 [Zophobas morio]|uniref:NACHT domain-containing protein n=1 Tax=Zophobas morio TaxID=2755281 RepID=A0AA38HZ75_9CUCU|nr:hypothetical protein Zmor_024571 [Zophobas morio]
MEKIETFKKRPGTSDKGRDYEDVVLANVVLRLLNDPRVKTFQISSNENDFGAFDDLVIKLALDKGNDIQVKAVQLKHTERKGLSLENLRAVKGDFSIRKYHESYTKIEQKVDELILFTNRPFNPPDNATFQLDGEEFYVKLIKREVSSDISENVSHVYQFEIVHDQSTVEKNPRIQEYQEFFRKFFLYTDQENCDTLEKITANKFKTTYCSDDETFGKFLKTVSKWNAQDGNKEKIDKKWTQLVLALHLLSSHTESLSFGPVNDKMKIFREAISVFDVTLIEDKSVETVKQLWGDVGKEKTIDFKKLNKVRRRYLPTLGYINDTDIGAIDPKAFTQLLWVMDECPLILRAWENMKNIIQLCPDKKFVLVGGTKDAEWVQKYSVFQNLSDLNPKPEIRKNVMQNFSISIQGKGELDLVTSFGNSEDFFQNITTDNLSEMLNGPCRVGGVKETLPEPYIERYISRNVVDNTYLEKTHQNTIIILNCANNLDKVKSKLEKCELIDINNFLLKHNQSGENVTNNDFNVNELNFNNRNYLDKGKKIGLHSNLNNNKYNFSSDISSFANIVYVGTRHYNDSELQQIYNEHKQTKQFHYFKILNDGKLEWLSSKGDVSDVEAYKLPDEHPTEENALWSSRLDYNINLIIGDPGMGKTKLVKSLKNKCSREYWTVLISPKDVNLFFRNSDLCKTKNCSDLFTEFITNKKYVSLEKLDRMFFEMCIKKNNVIYVWDALDEILNDNLDGALNIILDLSIKGFPQWVTSRRHLKTTLEKKFNLFSLGINQFNEREQEKYIRKRLKFFNSETCIDVTLEKIKSSFAIIEHIDILGIPLQIFMLTELFRENSEKYLKLMDNTFVLTDLYEYFIHEKFNKFYKDKIGYDLRNPQMEVIVCEKKRKAAEYYERVSFRVIFNEEIMQRLNIDYEKCVQKLFRNYASLGLVNDFQNDIPRFVHSSFAEYLVARYFSNNINNSKGFISDILFDARYNNVRFFFDMLLAKNSKGHIAVLYKRYELLKSYDDEILKRKDICGRSALHLISSWGQRHPRVKVTLVKDNCIVHENLNFDKKAETKIYFETMAYLQRKIDAGERDMLLDATPLTYARKSESLGAQIQLLQTKKHELRQSPDDIINVIYYSALLGYDDMCKYLTVEELKYFWCEVKIVTTEYGATPLWLACQNGNLKIIDYFVRSGVDINCVSTFGETPLFMASQNGHEKVVEYLATVGAEINRAQKDGATPLYVASHQGHEKVVEYLVTVGAEINGAQNNGPTPLHIASFKGHEKVVEYLVTVGAEINCVQESGATPLLVASHQGHEKVVEYLVTVGAEINRAQNDGATPLYVASLNGHQKVVEYLVTVGAEINRADNNGATPLYIASRNGHEKVVEYLVTVGAEINFVEESGTTPLLVASHQGHEKVVEYLVTVGAEINRAQNDGRTPLYVASQNGHQKVVEYLVTVGAEINRAINDGWTPLHISSQKGHQKVVEYLVTVGAEINGAQNNGRTPLHIASFNGHEKVVEYLVTVGAEINCVEENGATPLLVASHQGHEKVVEYLVTVGAEINRAQNDGETPLFVASQKGHKKVVEYLATVGAEINRAENDGWTPLHIASQNGHEKVVEYLVTVGAEINRAINNGATPLHIASQNGHEKVVEYLATVGAEINRAENDGWTPLHIASQNGHEKVVECLVTVGAEINRAVNNVWTPLHIASQNGHEKVVEYLVTVGAEINRAINDGWTPLHSASQNGHEKIVEYLATVGAEINRAEKTGGTPLYIASQNGHEKVVEYLATVGAEINRAENDGCTPLHIASQKGHEKVVEYLATVGAEINRAENDGWTPLHVASKNSHEKVVEYLATVGAEINCVANDGWTPLHLASHNGHEKVVECLVTVGAEINRGENDGWTPLHIASQNGHEKVVEYLVTVGAEINRAQNDGCTPLHIASQNGHEKIVEYLATVGAEINRADNYGWTPLDVASVKSYKNIVECLTRAGAQTGHHSFTSYKET